MTIEESDLKLLHTGLHPVPGDGRVPLGWLRSIDRACTAWLLKRGLLGSPVEDRVDTAGAPSEEDEEEAARAAIRVEAPDAAPIPAEAPALAAGAIDPDEEPACELAEAVLQEEAR
jgi:hypothetical protein